MIRLSSLGLLCFTLVLAACGRSTSAPPPTPAPTGTPTPSPTPTVDTLDLVARLAGKLEIKREGWQEYVSAGFGTPVRYGDLLHVDTEGSALVFCSDLQLVEMPGGYLGRSPCMNETPVIIKRGGSLVSDVRGEGIKWIPYIIHPRRTRLLIPRPFLQWHPVAGAITYTVSLRSEKSDVFTIDTTATHLQYPAKAPDLHPGMDYWVEVYDQVNDTGSKQEKQVDLGFSLLDKAQVAEIQSQVDQITDLPLDEAVRRFLVASLYATYKVRGEAIAELEKAIESLPEAVVYRVLGDLYQEVGLYGEAQTAYARALELASVAGDGEEKALAQRGLGQAMCFGGESWSEARPHLQAALDWYRTVGSEQDVADLSDVLATLPCSDRE